LSLKQSATALVEVGTTAVETSPLDAHCHAAIKLPALPVISFLCTVWFGYNATNIKRRGDEGVNHLRWT